MMQSDEQQQTTRVPEPRTVRVYLPNASYQDVQGHEIGFPDSGGLLITQFVQISATDMTKRIEAFAPGCWKRVSEPEIVAYVPPSPLAI